MEPCLQKFYDAFRFLVMRTKIDDSQKEKIEVCMGRTRVAERIRETTLTYVLKPRTRDLPFTYVLLPFGF